MLTINRHNFTLCWLFILEIHVLYIVLNKDRWEKKIRPKFYSCRYQRNGSTNQKRQYCIKLKNTKWSVHKEKNSSWRHFYIMTSLWWKPFTHLFFIWFQLSSNLFLKVLIKLNFLWPEIHYKITVLYLCSWYLWLN